MTSAHAPHIGAVSRQCGHALQLLPASMLVAAPWCVGSFYSHGSPSITSMTSQAISALCSARHQRPRTLALAQRSVCVVFMASIVAGLDQNVIQYLFGLVRPSSISFGAFK